MRLNPCSRRKRTVSSSSLPSWESSPLTIGSMYSLKNTSNNEPAARLAREQSAPVISGGRLRSTDTKPSGLLVNADRKSRSRSDQWAGVKSGLYSFRISGMVKQPTLLQGLVGSAIPLAVALAVILIATALVYTFWFGVDWITKYLF